MVYGRCRKIPYSHVSTIDFQRRRQTYQVAPNWAATDQNVMTSNPIHMIELPPEKTGANKLRTIPPTWNNGIMLTREQMSIHYET